MTLAWMVYCLLVSLLLGSAALAAERGLRLYGRPVRWLWVGAMAGSLMLPALMYVVPFTLPVIRSSLLPAIEVLARTEVTATTTALPASQSSMLFATIDDLLLVFWALASTTVFVFLLRSYFRLRRERECWSLRSIGNSQVFVSRRLGPAVSGLFRSRIVIPTWVLELDEDLRRLILLHEQEHLRAGDHRLLLTALVALALMPWNLPLWWQVRRLRLALEVDCDRRLLGLGVDKRAYGELLLEVGRRAAAPGLLQAAFAEPRSFLEERLQNMIEKAPKHRGRRLAIAATLAISLMALAFVAPSPATGNGTASTLTSDTRPPPEVTAQQDTTQPHFTPYTVGPDLKNRQAAVTSVESYYPDSLKAAGIGGTVKVWVYIDEQGVVRETRLGESSRIDALDQAALAAASEFEFTPALNRDQVVPVWVQIPIAFSTLSGGSTETAKFRLRAILRMIEAVQQHQYQETGEYYQSLDAILEQLRQARDQGMQAITPNEDEEVLFEAEADAWAAVARNGELECAVYYGDIAAPRPYAQLGNAVCR
jgi:TonB family protein